MKDNQPHLEIDEASINKEYWDSKAKETGFEDIENFLGYFRIHSQTPRALFSGQHAEIIFALAGYSQEERRTINPFNSFISIKPDSREYKILEKKVDSLI